MALFPLKQKTLSIRGQNVIVRELTAGERADIAKQSKADTFSATFAIAAAGCVSPSLTFDQAKEEPADVIGEISNHVMVLSGMASEDDDGEKKEDPKNA